jgi:hypothetical protein
MDRVALGSAWDQVWALVTELLGRPSVQLGYAVSAVVLVGLTLLAVQRARWGGGRSVVAVGGALSLALFPALTLARRGVDLRRTPSCDWDWALAPANAEQLLNLVLLFPAGLLGAWALRRIWPVLLVALVLSLGAEAIQATLDIGACQAADMARNVAGALAGAFCGVLLGWALLWGRARSFAH